MSGGALDYAYSRVSWVVDEIREKIPVYEYGDNPLWLQFAQHLELVAKALHDLEWEWSADYVEGGADEAIRACLKSNLELTKDSILKNQIKEKKLRQAIVDSFLEADDIMFGWTLDELITGGQGTIEQGRKKREELIDIILREIMVTLNAAES